MGKLLPTYKKALFDEMIENITSGNSIYYAFASNPVPYSNTVPSVTEDDYSALFTNNWQMMFGKRLSQTNFAPLIKNNQWSNNTVYDRYDNRDQNLHIKNNFYVLSSPDAIGGSYNIFKCIDNANGSPSTIKPSLIQPTTFQTFPDGYKWRYVASVSYREYSLFATPELSPVFSNTILSLDAGLYSGIDVVIISNTGSGYVAYNDGIVQSVNSSVIQIENIAEAQNEYYTNSAIYVYNTGDTTAQIFGITKYVANSVGKWVYVDGVIDTERVLPSSTNYKISPKVVFHTDGNTQPIAYSVVNPDNNGIANIVILDTGSYITWANVHVESNFGTGANLYAIVPPPGGHGYDVLSELDMLGFSVAFNFSNTENNTIPTDALYNKIGIVKDPHVFIANNRSKGNVYTSSTFNQLLEITLDDPVLFTEGDYVVGNTSNAVGTVVFANTSKMYLTGDKYFSNGEFIVSSNGSLSAQINVGYLGDVFTKDTRPLYIQNINNVERSNTQTESFQLIIRI